MFEDPPGCWLHRQGNFITGFFPEEVQEDLAANVGTFVYPGDEAGSTPVLGGGDLAALFNPDNEAAVQVMEFIASPEFGGPWAEAGGWLSPHATFDVEQYGDETTQDIATLAQEAEVFRFDGSDLMPAEVGAGTFWDEMVNWINGQKELEAALADIQESFPEE
jgi:alpha-glucoside transport system substrate-binding protein